MDGSATGRKRIQREENLGASVEFWIGQTETGPDQLSSSNLRGGEGGKHDLSRRKWPLPTALLI